MIVLSWTWEENPAWISPQSPSIFCARLSPVFGVQALVALCSSISLARRRKHQVPAFDLALALRRIAWRTVIGFLGVAVISALMIWLTAAPGTFGYLFGMILSFLKNLNRMTPNDRKNQRRFEKMFADCYPYEDELDGDDDF